MGECRNDDLTQSLIDVEVGEENGERTDVTVELGWLAKPARSERHSETEICNSLAYHLQPFAVQRAVKQLAR